MASDPDQISSRAELRAALAELREAVGRRYLEVATAAGLSQSTVHNWETGENFPRWKNLKELLRALGIKDDTQLEAWRRAYQRADKEGTGRWQGPAGAIPVAAADGLLLGVHPAVAAPGADEGTLPTYVPRDTDTEPDGVRETIRALAAESGFVLLVGGSSVGKTRCLYEAVRDLVPDWWLTQPATPGEITNLVGTVPAGAELVVWLDELQLFLGDECGLTVSTIRDLLRGPGRVLLVGTLWPQYHSAYVTLPDRNEPDRYAAERAIVELARVVHLEGFNAAEEQRARRLAESDPRIRAALQVHDYGLTQAMAAAPQLIARWRDADPYAAAVLNAALDAARLGVWHALPAALLRAAAPGYCDDQVRAQAPNTWFEDALVYASTRVHGAATALTPVAGRGMGRTDGYRPADYLVQYAGQVRVEEIGPLELWDALADHITDLEDLDRLALTARSLCLHRLVARFTKRAVLLGMPEAPGALLSNLQLAGREGLDDAVAWVLDHIADHPALSDLACAARLLDTLSALDVVEPRVELARRVSRLASVADTRAVAGLLEAFRDAAGGEAASVLAERAARQAPVEDVAAVLRLSETMDQIGAEEARRTLIERTSQQCALHPASIAYLLDKMEEMGASAGQAREALIRRVRDHAPVDECNLTRWFLDILLKRGGDEAAPALAERAADQTSLDKLSDIAWILQAMDRIGARDAVARLAGRAAGQAIFEDQPFSTGIDRLLVVMHDVGADESAHVLAGRAAADAPLNVHHIVGDLLEAMNAVGADAAMQVLADRAANYTPTNPFIYASHLWALHRWGVGEAVSILADRAARMPIDDPHAVVAVLAALSAVGTDEAARRLADRAAEDMPLDAPERLTDFLKSVDRDQFDQPARSLAARIARDVPLDDADAIGRLLYALVPKQDDGWTKNWLLAAQDSNAYGKAAQELAIRAARQIPLTNLKGTSTLLAILKSLGTQNAAQALANRLAHDAPLESATESISLGNLLAKIDEVGGTEIVEVLLERGARDMPVDEVRPVCALLEVMDRIGTTEAKQILATRAARQLPVGLPRIGYDPDGVDRFLKVLHQTHNEEPAGILAGRVAEIPLTGAPRVIAQLLDAMNQMGFATAATRLADRAAAHVVLDDPAGLADLLSSIGDTNTYPAAHALAMRAAQHAPVDDPTSSARLYYQLRYMGAGGAMKRLLARIEKRHFGLYLNLAPRDQQERFQHGREPDGTPSQNWGWHSL